MELKPKYFDQILDEFLSSWPLERIENMTLEEYSNLDDRDSLCYWLEYRSKYLGAIGNNPLTKFGIWKPKSRSNFKDMFLFDGEYTWYRTKGKTREEAFENVRSEIIKTVKFSVQEEWEKIEQIELHSLVKWKLAFLYSDKKLLPIYSKPALLKIARGLGNQDIPGAGVYQLQQSILSQKGKKSIDDFAHEIYTQFASKPNYYVIGTKYISSNNEIKDIFPEMIRRNCVAIGYLWGHDLSHIRNETPAEIDDFVSNNRDQSEPSLGKLKSQIKHFLNLKNGDIIAIKSKGSYNNLTIIAYAIVVSRNGKVYEHDPKDLGHITHVEFLETGFKKETHLNYADSIHKIGARKDHFKQIFGKYAIADSDDIEIDEFETTDDNENNIYEKSELEHFRKGSAEVLVKQVHNKIQNRFVKYLDESFPDRLRVEHKGQVDILRSSQDCLWFYEIKPYESAYRCIRESIGQLLDYSYQYDDGKETKLITVGPSNPDERAIDFIKYIQEKLTGSYSYISFDFENGIAINEY